MEENPPTEVDVVIVRRLAGIHPLNLPRLRSALLTVLTSTTGIAPDHSMFVPLATMRDSEDIENIEWEALDVEITVATCLPADACWTVVEHVRLFAQRSVLHQCLYLAKSAVALRMTYTWPIPPDRIPGTLLPDYDEFEQALIDADRALQAGRACLQVFQHLIPHAQTLSPLHNLLTRANSCYIDYRLELQEANRLAATIIEQLTQTQTNSPAA